VTNGSPDFLEGAMPNQIMIFLLDTLLGLFSLALLLRFYMQWFRVPYYHPVSRFLITVTDFIVRPSRRLIPSWRGLDLLIMIIVQAVLSWVNPHSPLAPVLESFTQPILGVFRRFIPPIANVDLSPLFALILLQILLMVVSSMQRGIILSF